MAIAVGRRSAVDALAVMLMAMLAVMSSVTLMAAFPQ
jgi:hypothetical protein